MIVFIYIVATCAILFGVGWITSKRFKALMRVMGHKIVTDSATFNMIDSNQASNTVFTIYPGGRIVVAHGKTLDDAAICFWVCVAKYCPPQCSVEVLP